MSDTIHALAAEPAALRAVDGRQYPLLGACIVARAEGGTAMSTLVQRFANPYDEPLEVLYTMPLPVDGAVTGYTVRIGERVIRSEVQPREQASKAYKKALFQGRTAGLLEQSRPDTFQQSLGNVPPNTEVEITIDVLHPLSFLTPAPRASAHGFRANDAWSEPQWEYRFPTVVNVRYMGAPGQVPDAKDLSPDRGARGTIPARMELNLTVAGELGVDAPTSPSHALDVSAGGPDCSVSLRAGERLDRDVVVRWQAATEVMGVRLVEGRGLDGDPGRYALVTLVPPAAPERVFQRDLTVLIDASGSMAGAPLELGRRVVSELLRSLGHADRYELIAFASSVNRLTPGFVSADERAIERGVELLAGLQASGGTDMVAGIQEAMKSARGDAQRQVILVTDGQIGFEHDVVARVADQANVRLHAVGVGSAVNRSLTQQAAFAGRGVELLVTDQADAAAAGRRLVAATASPVLTRLKVSGSALTGEQQTRLRDVFGGQPLLFTVELRDAGGTLELKGDLAGQSWSHRVELPALVPGAAPQWAKLPTTPLPLGALHGRALVGEYELGRAAHGGHGAHSGMIERCAMRHRIASSRTSLVAIAEEPGVDPNAPRRRERLVVELPEGVSAYGVGLEETYFGAPAAMASARHPRYGALAGPAPTAARARTWWGSADAANADARAFAGHQEPPTPQEALAAHWFDEETLVVEFEVRFAGVIVEGDVAQLTTLNLVPLAPRELSIDWRHSTRRGDFRPGRIVRVALRLPKSFDASNTRRIMLLLPTEPTRDRPTRSQLMLIVEIPERPPTGPGPGEGSPGA